MMFTLISGTTPASPGFWLFFIPPKYTDASTNLNIEVGTDLSLNETPVLVKDAATGIIHQKLDVDGAPIWRRTFKGTITAAQSAYVSVNLSTGIKSILTFSGWAQIENTNDVKDPFGIPVISTTNVARYSVIILSNGTAIAGFGNNTGVIAAPYNNYEVTLEYTKL
jgi:hypothetical protein